MTRSTAGSKVSAWASVKYLCTPPLWHSTVVAASRYQYNRWSMKEFKGKTAVITGAASGIGRAMADRFAKEGMNVVLADIEETALGKAVH